MFYEPLKPNMGPLVLRWGLASILLYHGGFKFFYGGGTGWLADLHPYVQLAVAAAEVIAGLLLIVGFLTRFASLAVAVIQLGAIVLVTGPRGFMDISTRPAGEPVGSISFQVGWEYNLALIVIALGLFFLGSGALSVDDYLWRRQRKTAAEPQAPQPLQPAGGAAPLA
jgi:putative oxidoreductase